MTAMIVPQDVVDTQLAQCVDGETGDFTIVGGTFKLVPGVGAVISGETVTKQAGAAPPATAAVAAVKPAGHMSPMAAAVVKRKPTY